VKEFLWSDHRRMSGEDFHVALQREDYVSSFPRHGHRDMCEWVCVVAGTMRHEAGSSVREEGRGSVTLIRPGDVHLMSGSKFSIVNLAFPPSAFDLLGPLLGFPGLRERVLALPEPPRVLVSEEDFAPLENCLMKMISIGRGPLARQQFCAFSTALLAERFAFLFKAPEGSSTPDWLRDCLDWLDRDADKDVSLAELRRRACKCPARLSRAFMEHVGVSPSAYLAGRRLECASNLLAGTNCPVSEIAAKAGFQNLSHFCRKFKERFGATPKEWREARWIPRS